MASDRTYAAATSHSQLTALGKDWTIVLSCRGAAWTLEMLPLECDPNRIAGKRYTYVGTLSSVIARAYAGEPGDR